MILFALGGSCACASSNQPHTAPSLDTHPWEHAESDLHVRLFSLHAEDSLLQTYGFGPQMGLRKNPSGQLSFAHHERLVFDAGWEFVRVGYGIFDAEKHPETGRMSISAKMITNDGRTVKQASAQRRTPQPAIQPSSATA